VCRTDARKLLPGSLTRRSPILGVLRETGWVLSGHKGAAGRLVRKVRRSSGKWKSSVSSGPH